MKKLLVCALALSLGMSFGQGAGVIVYGMAAGKTGLISGDVKSLDNVSKVNILFDHKDMLIGAKGGDEGNYMTEVNYLTKKTTELEEKEKGRGVEFKESWEKAKTGKYPEKFEELFNKYGPEDINMGGKYNGSDAKVNMTIKTTLIDPGWNVGVMKKPSFIDIEAIFTDKAGKELCRFFVKNVLGSNGTGFDYNIASRVVESYAKSAKMLVNVIKKARKGE